MDVHNPATTVPPVQSDSGSRGERTRERLLDLAYESVIRKGFAATSVEELVEAGRITKSGFFYHFRDKNDLARQMLERYLSDDIEVTRSMALRARELNDDPLHAYLVFLKFYAEMIDEVARTKPGCLIATVAFQKQAFAPEVGRINDQIVRAWRQSTVSWLEEIARAYPPEEEVDLRELADGFIALAIGGLAIAKAIDEPGAAARQVLVYRDLVRRLFSPARAQG